MNSQGWTFCTTLACTGEHRVHSTASAQTSFHNLQLCGWLAGWLCWRLAEAGGQTHGGSATLPTPPPASQLTSTVGENSTLHCRAREALGELAVSIGALLRLQAAQPVVGIEAKGSL